MFEDDDTASTNDCPETCAYNAWHNAWMYLLDMGSSAVTDSFVLSFWILFVSPNTLVDMEHSVSRWRFRNWRLKAASYTCWLLAVSLQGWLYKLKKECNSPQGADHSNRWIHLSCHQRWYGPAELLKLSKVHDLILNRLGAVYGEGCSSLLCLTIFNLLSNLSKIFQLKRFVIRNIQVFILLFFFGKKEACCMHKLSFRWQSAPSRHIAAQLTACNRAGTLQMSWQVDVVAAEPKVVRMVQEKLMIGHSYNGSSIILTERTQSCKGCMTYFKAIDRRDC